MTPTPVLLPAPLVDGPPPPDLTGVHPSGRREQSGGVQRRGPDEGRRAGRVQERQSRQPV